jgi:hypothetical protein
MWPENIGASVQSDFVASLGANEFAKVKNAAHLEFDNEAKLNKTALFIGQLLTLAKEKGAKSPSLPIKSGYRRCARRPISHVRLMP